MTGPTITSRVLTSWSVSSRIAQPACIVTGGLLATATSLHAASPRLRQPTPVAGASGLAQVAAKYLGTTPQQAEEFFQRQNADLDALDRLNRLTAETDGAFFGTARRQST